MKLMRNIAILGLSLTVGSAFAQEKKSAFSGLFELSTTFIAEHDAVENNLPVVKKAALEGSLYSNVGYAATANNSLVAEMLTPAVYPMSGADFDLSHGWIRLSLMQKGAFKVSDWQTLLQWRYQPPTDAATATAGGFGTFMLRPQISKKFGDFGLMARNGFLVHINDQQYQKYTGRKKPPGTGRAAPEGNVVGGNVLTVIPTYKLAENLQLGLEMNFQNIYKGNPPGAVKADWKNTFGYELSLTLDTSKSLSGVLSYATLSVSHEADYSDFSIYSGLAKYNFKIGHSF